MHTKSHFSHKSLWKIDCKLNLLKYSKLSNKNFNYPKLKNIHIKPKYVF